MAAITAPGGVRVSLTGELPDAPAAIVADRAEHGTTIDGALTTARLVRLDPERAVLREDAGGEAHLVLLPAGDARQGPSHRLPSGTTRREVVVDGWRFDVTEEPAHLAALRERARRGSAELGSSGPTKVHAIIPGVVVAVSVAPGDAVTAGQQLLVVEAMKMQNELRAPRDGTIEQVAVGVGSTIELGDLLLVLA
ncbi:MAG TPA: biotin/lipoyl-containing protein [Candidatus Limnocylindrales bacterium]|nr:biotin/lipoyl-containing protein [Candidatus Limnocylindrales bacterium]